MKDANDLIFYNQTCVKCQSTKSNKTRINFKEIRLYVT